MDDIIEIKDDESGVNMKNVIILTTAILAGAVIVKIFIVDPAIAAFFLLKSQYHQHAKKQ